MAGQEAPDDKRVTLQGLKVEIERQERASPLTVPACPMCGHKGGKLIDNVGVPTEVCEVATCDCECEFPTAQGDTAPAGDSEI